MDVIPTIMPFLGVTNPATDYTTGYNLLKGEKRDYTYISDWDKVAYVDDEVKIIQPVNSNGFMTVKASRANDATLADHEQKSILQNKQTAMLQLVKDLSKFFKKKQTTSSQ
jgi:hypothetical protein